MTLISSNAGKRAHDYFSREFVFDDNVKSFVANAKAIPALAYPSLGPSVIRCSALVRRTCGPCGSRMNTIVYQTKVLNKSGTPYPVPAITIVLQLYPKAS